MPCTGSPWHHRALALTAHPQHTTDLPGHLAQGPVPQEQHRQVTPAMNMIWHLLRDPRWEALGFFYGFANYSVFLCGLPPECVPGMGPSPGSSSKRDSSWQAAAREGEDHPGWEASTVALLCALCALAAAAVSPHRWEGCTSIPLAWIQLSSPCTVPWSLTLAPVTRTRSSRELPALCTLPAVPLG